MVRQSGTGNVQFFLNLANYETVGVSRQEQLHDSEARLGSHCRKHVGKLGYLFGGFAGLGCWHSSIVAEI
jgi:hypothetical protein